MTLEPGDSAAAAGAAPRGCQFKRETARAAGEVDAAASLGCGEQTADRTRGPAGDGGGADGAVGSEVPAPLAASTRAPDAGPAPSTEIAPEIAADGADPEILREDRDGGADGADGAETPEDSVESSSEKGTPGAGVCPANRAATANSEGAGEVRLPQTAQGAKAFTIDGRAVPDVDESIVDFHPNGTLRSQRELEVLVPEEYKTASGMVPRSYQLELFQRALRGNCIAVLDTGSGKTFVAVLLVKHMFSEELVRRKSTKQRRHTFFLVPTVPLVHQQARVLRANTPAVVRELSGGMDLDLESWNVEMWQMEFEVTDIFVCTPHVLLSMLRKAFMMMEKINLLVFDEAHHARKNHAYNMIMMEFYSQCPSASRPKIFGLTASPSNSKTGVDASIKELEQNLSARVFTATRGEDVLQFMYRPEEDVIRYAAPRKYEACESPLYEELVAKLSRISNSKVKRMLSDADWTFKNLGPWAGTHVLVTALRDTEVNTLDKLPSSVSNKGGNKAESGEDEGASRWRKEGPNVNPFTEEEMKYLHEAIDTRDSRPELAPRMNENSLSPKLMTVLKVLQSFSLVPEFRGIVFVERRRTASQLCDLIRHFKPLQFIIPEPLVGHGSAGGSMSVRMAHNEQRNVLERFRTGETNLLVATKVAEEGLDIPECMLVVRFDCFKTFIEYVQSRGRARMAGSHYILMVQAHVASQEAIYNDTIEYEKEIDRWIKEHADGSLVDDDDEDTVEDDAALAHVYRVPSTGAMLTMNGSTSLLHYYCSLLPKDFYCRLNPIFDVESGFAKSGFVCTITLPSNASVRTVTSDVMRSKKLAKQHAALRACVALHHEGGLDDYLMPFRVKVAEDLPFTEQDLQGRKKKLRKYPIQIPKLWGITAAGPKEPVPPDDALNSPSPVPATAPAPPLIMSRLHMTLLHLDRDAALAATGQTYHPLALLTARPLPDTCDFWLYFEMSTTPVNMQIRGLGPPVSLDLTQLKLLMKYTLNICSAPVNKEFICEPHDFPFLVCPLLTEKVGRSGFPAGNGAEVATVASVHLIDWPSVRTTVARRFYSISLPALNDPTTSAGVLDMVIVDHADEGRRYFVKAIRRDLMPHTYIAEPSPREKLAGVNTIADYYLKKFQRKPTQALQPLLEVTKISKTLNYLTPKSRTKGKQKHSVANVVIPEFCRAFCIPAPVFRSALLLPSILTRLDSQLLAWEVRSKFTLDVRSEYILDAFTAPSANFLRDYERLEHLGDSFLKFVTTTYLYIRYPTKHEGQLHHQRIRIVANRSLFKSSKSMMLPSYMTVSPFNKKLWRPRNFTTRQQDMQKSPTHQLLSDKTVADAVEATLGACWLSYGLEAALHCANVCQIPLGNQPDWGSFAARWKAHPLLSRDDVEKIVDLPHIEEAIGYRFNMPQLALEAFTHASYPFAITPCYQRLEFLGDAVLDFLVVQYNYKRYPHLSPGGLTELKDASVNANILAACCERIGVFSHILHFSNDLMKNCEEFMWRVAEMRARSELKPEYWFDMTPPKVLSDIVEALLGAVLVDSGFKLEAAEHVMDKIYKPLLDEFIDPHNLKQHPVRKLADILQLLTCEKYRIDSFEDESVPGRKVNDWVCEVYVHGQLLGRMKGEHNKAARWAAAEFCLERLNEDSKLFMNLCDCREQRKLQQDNVDDEAELTDSGDVDDSDNEDDE